MHTVFNNIHSLLNKNIDSIFALLDVFKLLQSLVYMSYNKNVSCQNIRETEQQTSLKHEIFTHCQSKVIAHSLWSAFSLKEKMNSKNLTAYLMTSGINLVGIFHHIFSNSIIVLRWEEILQCSQGLMTQEIIHEVYMLYMTSLVLGIYDHVTVFL